MFWFVGRVVALLVSNHEWTPTVHTIRKVQDHMLEKEERKKDRAIGKSKARNDRPN